MTTLTIEQVVSITSCDSFPEVANRCHEVSLAIVKSGILPAVSRVARGFCDGVVSQHSWISVGDLYCVESELIDPTLWCHQNNGMYIWHGTLADKLHQPHGWFDGVEIWDYGRPVSCDPTEAVELNPAMITPSLRKFLEVLGPMSIQGWADLASNFPVLGWPFSELYMVMVETPRLAALVPVDRLGMLTDLNPGGMYF